MQAHAADAPPSPLTIFLLCAAAWAVPGAGHVLLGRAAKGAIFFVTLTLMFATGLALEGRLFPFDLTQPLVALAAVADLGMGVPYFVARALDAGTGRVIAITFEYGNAFAIVAGLLNMLVVLDTFDIAQGRK
jgi:hypothetical protein